MANCPECGKKLGVFEPHDKIKKNDGKIYTYHKDCADKVIKKLRADFNRTSDCTFQMRTDNSEKTPEI